MDESKSGRYILAVAVVERSDVSRLRAEVRSLVLPGQSRIHFTKERDQRKRKILSCLIDLGIQAHVFESFEKSETLARKSCLSALVSFAAQGRHSKIVLERDESIVQSDRRILYQESRLISPTEWLTYELEVPRKEPLLWLADVIAWSYAKGGDWQRRVNPLISGVTKVAS